MCEGTSPTSAVAEKTTATSADNLFDSGGFAKAFSDNEKNNDTMFKDLGAFPKSTSAKVSYCFVSLCLFKLYNFFKNLLTILCSSAPSKPRLFFVAALFKLILNQSCSRTFSFVSFPVA